MVSCRFPRMKRMRDRNPTSRSRSPLSRAMLCIPLGTKPVIWGIYPLVNIPKTMERSTMLLMAKSTISMAIYHSYVNVYQAGYPSCKKTRWLSTGDPLSVGGKISSHGWCWWNPQHFEHDGAKDFIIYNVNPGWINHGYPWFMKIRGVPPK